MSALLLIILVGVALIGVSVLSSLGKKDSGTQLINPKVGIPLGVLGVAMIIYGSYTSDVAHVSSQMEQITRGNKVEIEGPVTSVRVISPVEADSVDCRILSMSTPVRRFTGRFRPLVRTMVSFFSMGL